MERLPKFFLRSLALRDVVNDLHAPGDLVIAEADGRSRAHDVDGRAVLAKEDGFVILQHLTGAMGLREWALLRREGLTVCMVMVRNIVQ